MQAFPFDVKRYIAIAAVLGIGFNEVGIEQIIQSDVRCIHDEASLGQNMGYEKGASFVSCCC
jgi:hypothetical protein